VRGQAILPGAEPFSFVGHHSGMLVCRGFPGSPLWPPGVDIAAHIGQPGVVVGKVDAQRAAAARLLGPCRMVAASSTRVVAALMLGTIDGCTPPIRISISISISTRTRTRTRTWCGCSCLGHNLARGGVAPGTYSLSDAGSSGRAGLPGAIAGPNSGEDRPSASSQCSAYSPTLRAASAATADVCQVAVPHAAGTGGLALATAEAAAEALLAGTGGRHAFEHLLHQVNAPVRTGHRRSKSPP
jgi:hypothetical protein